MKQVGEVGSDFLSRLEAVATKLPDEPTLYHCHRCRDLGYELNEGGERQYRDEKGHVHEYVTGVGVWWGYPCHYCDVGRAIVEAERIQGIKAEIKRITHGNRELRRKELIERERNRLESGEPDGDLPPW